ncbi:TetR family transcriptional regulator [Lentilactobacillus fungorum]|uniref:TetR family transcriptional regulator n=1 Tax=Lentilactobacillus fungorum TaxID=2201250 RepID=A0ABQ3VZB3_9LACO|nr:TetR/AcrR family transcriptional regulator [Lentilactobacillus fungorum]GHP14238.1 TetR family transcriptional regulator [Lentilactobacillus fungorum]
MVGIKNNRRTKYTIHAIKAAMLVLLESEPLSKITVTEICKQADVNRGTFYLHFDNPDSLFEAIENDISAEVMPLLRVHQKDNLQDWGRRLVSVVENNQVAMRVILKAQREDKITMAIFSEAHELFLNDFSKQFGVTDQRILEYYFTFFISGSIGVFNQWLNDEHPIPKDEIVKMLVSPYFLTNKK